MKISVLGLGYVGSVTAACFAKAGHEVIGVDTNAEKVALVNGGKSPVIEPGLTELISEMVSARRLRAVTLAEDAVRQSELAVVCVGTPGRANGQLDLAAVERVSRDIGAALRDRTSPFILVLRSTVIPGTTEGIVAPAVRAAAGDAFSGGLKIAFNPEFMREGSSLRDFAEPPFTLVGCDDGETQDRLATLYSHVRAPFIRTTVKTAEMVKYVGNAFHALKVCFANEVGDVCQALGVDAAEVVRLFLRDKKLNISGAYLSPGFAFGGSCLPKDLRALLYAARANDVTTPLLAAIMPSNDAQIRRGVDSVLRLRKKKIGVVGLSFKANTDDLRESPLVLLVEALIGKGCEVRILDRNVSIARLVGANRRYIEEEIPHIASLLCGSVEELLQHAEVLVIGNTSDEAAAVLKSARREQTVIDLTRSARRVDSERSA